MLYITFPTMFYLRTSTSAIFPDLRLLIIWLLVMLQLPAALAYRYYAKFSTLYPFTSYDCGDIRKYKPLLFLLR